MMQIQISLPDQLARDAARAGLLASEAIAESLRLQLKSRGRATLEAIWSSPANTELTPADEQEIAEAIRRIRSERQPDEIA